MKPTIRNEIRKLRRRVCSYANASLHKNHSNDPLPPAITTRPTEAAIMSHKPSSAINKNSLNAAKTSCHQSSKNKNTGPIKIARWYTANTGYR